MLFPTFLCVVWLQFLEDAPGVWDGAVIAPLVAPSSLPAPTFSWPVVFHVEGSLVVGAV